MSLLPTRSEPPYALPDGDGRRAWRCAQRARTTETVHRVPTRVAERGIPRGMARKVASWQARLPSPAITRILHRLWPSRRCSPSPEQEPRHTAGPPDTRARGEVRSRAAGRTWADAHAEGGISPRVTGLRGGCPITISVLLKLV